MWTPGGVGLGDERCRDIWTCSYLVKTKVYAPNHRALTSFVVHTTDTSLFLYVHRKVTNQKDKDTQLAKLTLLRTSFETNFVEAAMALDAPIRERAGPQEVVCMS